MSTTTAASFPKHFHRAAASRKPTRFVRPLKASWADCGYAVMAGAHYQLVCLTARADAVIEASRSKDRCRATERRSRAFGRALRLGTRLFLRYSRDRHRGLFGLGCHRFLLRRGRLDGRLAVRHRGHLIVRHRRLILAVRVEQIAHEATPGT
jgi:hypothetical protein